MSKFLVRTLLFIAIWFAISVAFFLFGTPLGDVELLVGLCSIPPMAWLSIRAEQRALRANGARSRSAETIVLIRWIAYFAVWIGVNVIRGLFDRHAGVSFSQMLILGASTLIMAWISMRSQRRVARFAHLLNRSIA